MQKARFLGLRILQKKFRKKNLVKGMLSDEQGFVKKLVKMGA